MVPQDSEVVQECSNNYTESIVDNSNARDKKHRKYTTLVVHL